jgi:protein-L-isoaspartate(D-aspartate) O-methyltransferase
LVEQLADKGKLAIPVGGRFYQELVLIEKDGTQVTEKTLGGCIFVPLIGKDGHAPDY